MSEKNEAERRIADLEAMHERGTIKRGHIGEMLVNLRFLHAENESLRQIVNDFPPVEAELREVSDRAHRLEAQRDALLADAERYRWLALRAHKNAAYDIYGNGAHWSIGFVSDDSRHTLDAAIDAIKAVEEGK